MSDPDAMPDPIDQAYVEAEAVLNDEVARAARRARVLAAVARRGALDAAEPAAQPRLWRRGGWLVAACVSALALFVAVQVYRPPTYLPPPKSPAAPAAPANRAAAPSPAPQSLTQAPAQALQRPEQAAPPQSPPVMAAPRAAKSQPEPPLLVAQSPAPPPPPAAPFAGNLKPWPSPGAEAAPPPPLPADAARDQAGAVQAANQPPPRPRAASESENVTEITVTSEKRESRRQSVPAAISAFTGRVREAFDPGAKLRTAATAGRTSDLEALLARGAPVDAADADGDTPLMKSIEADQPAAAALLRQHGASLDRQNHAGESARDMARDKGDADLNQALGLNP
jgi:hypothetical protein